jgi:hypothetical protein
MVDVNLQTVLDRARELDRERLNLDRQSKLLKAEIDDLSALAITLMHQSGLKQYDGARLEVKVKPYISDYTALEGYIREHGALDLLQKRLTESAVKLRWDDGVAIPGVGVIEEEKLVIK